MHPALDMRNALKAYRKKPPLAYHLQVRRSKADADIQLPSEILQEHWHVHEPVEKTDLGVSRKTWRVGQRYWLSQGEIEHLEPFVRESESLQRLHQFLRRERFSIEVPEIVLARGGQLVVAESGWTWRLTRHLAGTHPDSRDPKIYPPLIEGLSRFHEALRRFSHQDSGAIPAGVCIKTRQLIQRFQSTRWSPFTSDEDEQELLERASQRLLPRLDRFESLPRQVIHGDWTPRNVLFDSIAPVGNLTGVLDFESTAFDPIHVDLSHTCSTLLMWSGLDNTGTRIPEAVACYERLTGTPVELNDLHTAMLAHWFCHYWNWRDRLESGAKDHEVTKRLCLRLRLVLRFLEDSDSASK